uniref:Uncharacterized protein n=1 Tax=Oryza nivara TaxID=4536 RepID=A0A0E0H0S2_ORYNI
MAMDAFGSVFGEAKPPVAMRMRPILFHAHAHTNDVSQLRLLATDLHSLAWDRSLSLSDIDDLEKNEIMQKQLEALSFLDKRKVTKPKLVANQVPSVSDVTQGSDQVIVPAQQQTPGRECEELCCKILRKMSKNSQILPFLCID